MLLKSDFRLFNACNTRTVVVCRLHMLEQLSEQHCCKVTSPSGVFVAKCSFLLPVQFLPVHYNITACASLDGEDCEITLTPILLEFLGLLVPVSNTHGQGTENTLDDNTTICLA